ncbi:MAG: hypothetical protein ACI3XI_06085 [Eubacteriales bacterium]
MVKKLYKYEFKSYGLWALLLYAVMILTAVILIVSLRFFFDNPMISREFIEENVWDDIVVAAAGTFYGVSIIACFTMVGIMSLVRFYKHLLSTEGYLTLSLPVTPTQHIVCKTVVALVYQLGAVMALGASFMVLIIGSGEAQTIFEEVWKAIPEFLEMISQLEAIYIIDIIVASISLLLAPLASLFMYYFCLACGMLFGKLKLAGSVIIYIAISTATSVLTSIGQVLLIPFVSAFDSPEAFVSVICFGLLIVMVAQVVAYFLATKYLFTHKVNL